MQCPGLYRSMAGVLLSAQLSTLAATNTATLQLFCTSVRLEKGQAVLFGQPFFEMEFSSYFNWGNPNGEFYNLFSDFPPTHQSGLYLTDPALPGFPGTEGGITISVPENLDEDNDGVPDFYEVKNGVNAQLGGGSFVLFNPQAPEQPFDSGTVTTHWIRGANQHRGQCTLTLAGRSVITTPLDFVHPFEIVEYRGVYSYVPTNGPVVSGQVTVMQTGESARSLRGALPVERPPTDPLNAVVIQEATWTDDQADPIRLLGGYLDLDSEYEIEYFGALELEDGDLSTPDEPDYETYYVALDDPNDYDGDGVPDLNDPPPVETPALKMTRSALAPVPVLQITGAVGQALEIQFTPSLSPPSWTSVLSEPITLPKHQYSLELPAPPASGGFYRTLLVDL